MKLESDGILIDLRPFGERDMVARIFTADFGVLCGMMRGAQIARTNKPLVGQFGGAVWNARLDSQLGTFHWESEKNLAAGLMMRRDTLEYMNCAFALLVALVPEREQYGVLYDETISLMQNLNRDSSGDAYLHWEMALLRELGYALDLSACAGCGVREKLMYLSPRTGRAVCASCGAPYADKLYKLPLDLSVTRRFLERVCFAQGIELPVARRMLKIG